MIWVIIRVLSQTIPRLSASILIMPMHTTIGGTAKGDLGQHFAAIADFDIAIRLKPDNANAYYNRGTVKGDLGQHFAAIADF